MLHNIERAHGINLEVSDSLPFYAFLCVDLIASMDGQMTDKRELVCTVRSHPQGSTASDTVLATNRFDFHTDGLEDCMEYIASLRTRRLCANSDHDWCKLALPNYHLCSLCTIKKWAAGGDEKGLSHSYFSEPGSHVIDFDVIHE